MLQHTFSHASTGRSRRFVAQASCLHNLQTGSLRYVIIFAIAILVLITTASSYSQNYGQVPAVPQAQPIALVGATVHPVSAAPIENATVVFDHGKIIALGQNITIPANALRIEAKGKHIYPSLIAANTTLGLIEIGAVRATNDMSETGAINPNVRGRSRSIPTAK